MKEKIMGIFGTLLVALMLIAPASAATDVSISTSAVIPPAASYTVDKTALSFNLSSYGSFINAAQGEITISNTGNVAMSFKSNMQSVNPGISYQLGSFTLGVNDVDIGSVPVGGNLQLMPSAKAAAGTAPGTFTNTIYIKGS